MITPADIQKKALRQYKAFLSAVLTRTHFFPLSIKGNKGKANLPMDELFPALKRLLDGAKSKKGYGYTVTLKTVQTRHAGEISMPDEIYFENVEDYVKFIDKEAEFLAFRKVAMQSQKKLPTLLLWMQENPLKVLKHLAVWETLLKIGQYFIKHPRPLQYARALPLDIAPTFIENHRSILSAILDAILPSSAIEESETLFERRFGLLYEEPLLRMRALDNQVFDWDIKDISLPLSTWKEQSPAAQTIFICTDLMNCLRFPSHPKSLIIYGTPMAIAVLQELTWLQDKTCYFWGDVSNKGFQQLATIRSFLPQSKSFLMDRKTFEKHQAEAITVTKDSTAHLPVLLKEEREFLMYLNSLEEPNQLEQKHISQTYLKQEL